MKRGEKIAKSSTKRNNSDSADIFLERLNVAFGGFAHFQLLYSACKIDLFGYLVKQGSASIEKMSRDLKTPEYSLRVLLMGCSFLGLLEKKGNFYSTSPLAELYAKDHPQSQWPILNGYHSIVYPAMHRLSESLDAGTNIGLQDFRGSGKTLYERLAFQPKKEKVFHEWMHALSRTVGLTWPVLEFLRPTLEKVTHLVDYGGGDGANAIKLCKHYPHLKVTIFDSASVCDLANKNIKDAGMTNRISIKEGNFLKDPFIKKVDGVMFNHIFNIYSKSTNASLLRKSCASLLNGGVALVFNTVSFDSEDGPACAPVLSAYFLGLATGEGMVYPLKDYDDWFDAAGFRNGTKYYIPEINHGLIVATK